HDVWMLAFDRGLERIQVRAGGDNFDVFGDTQELAHTLANDVAVVGEHDANRHREPSISPSLRFGSGARLTWLRDTGTPNVRVLTAVDNQSRGRLRTRSDDHGMGGLAIGHQTTS